MLIVILKILCLLYALWTAISLIICIIQSTTAADITYFLCRPLLIFSESMFMGVILWVVFIVFAVYALNWGLTLLI